MSLNCAEIENIIKTLPQKSSILGISSLSKNDIAILIKENDSILEIVLNIDTGYNRIFRQEPNKKRKNTNRFGQWLESFLEQSTIRKIYQHNMSRLIIFEITKNTHNFLLVARMWGSGSNILLLDKEYTILECLRRFPKRQEWPGEKITLPDSGNGSLFTVRQEFLNIEINSAVKHFYNNIIKESSFESIKTRVSKMINSNISKLEYSIDHLKKYLARNNSHRYLKYGELLKQNFYLLHNGQNKILLQDEDEQKDFTIKLNPQRTPSQNIKDYFSKYKKSQTEAKNKIEQQKIMSKKLVQLEEYKIIIESTDTIQGIINIEKIVQKEFNLTDIPPTKSNHTPSLGRHFILHNGFKAIVSRNAKEADQILKRSAKGNDYWLHIRDYPGSHVIINCPKGKEIDYNSKIEAANLAVFYSKGREHEYADVSFTYIKYVHKKKGTAAGLVFPTQEKTIRIKPNKKILDTIFGR